MFVCETKTIERFIMGQSPADTMAARLSEMPKKLRAGVAQESSRDLKMLVQKSNQQAR